MVTFLEAEKANQVADQIVTAATRLNRYYASRGGHIEADDLQQQMWLHLMERQHDQGFLARPVNEIVKMLTWRAQGWARAEFKRHTNRIYSYDSPIFPIHHHVQDILTDEHDQTWELIALEIDTDTYTDPHLPELIERALASLEG
ncbi:MAG: hypothetical protein GTO49_18850, partial [Anaerolineae bacterium]|nr:hypothetical protein [Anaerolineae bacterium]